MADSKISALPASTTPLAGTEVLPIVQSSTTKQVSVANLTAGRAVSTLSVTSLGPNGIPITLQEITAAPSSATAAYVGVSTSAFPGGANGDLILIPRTSSANDVRIFVGSGTPTEALVVQGSTKDVRIGTGNLVPATAGKGINFTANTPLAGMTSQLLNWYEEGTYTPTATNFVTISGTASWSGKYTRVGRLMTVYFIVTGGNFTITQGSTTISLPKAATGYETGLIVNPNTSVGNYGFQVASGNSFGYVGTTATGTGFAGSVTYIV